MVSRLKGGEGQSGVYVLKRGEGQSGKCQG